MRKASTSFDSTQKRDEVRVCVQKGANFGVVAKCDRAKKNCCNTVVRSYEDNDARARDCAVIRHWQIQRASANGRVTTRPAPRATSLRGDTRRAGLRRTGCARAIRRLSRALLCKLLHRVLHLRWIRRVFTASGAIAYRCEIDEFLANLCACDARAGFLCVRDCRCCGEHGRAQHGGDYDGLQDVLPTGG